MIDGVVVDASVVVAGLLRSDAVGAACADLLLTDRIVAPASMPFEVVSAIRGQERGGLVDSQIALAAARVVTGLAFEEWPSDLLIERIWELRANVSAYDASYVAIAEMAELPLATLDLRLVRAPGTRCTILVPS